MIIFFTISAWMFDRLETGSYFSPVGLYQPYWLRAVKRAINQENIFWPKPNLQVLFK